MCHVLIIEDEPLIAAYLQILVEENGATSVAIATTEIQAIEAAGANLPAVITSDINLGLDSGAIAVAAIRERYGMIPVIFVTARAGGCPPLGELTQLIEKPIHEPFLIKSFRKMVPEAL